MDNYFRELNTFFLENGLSVDRYQVERLANFATLLAKKNEEINLISRKDMENIIENHIFFSAFLSEYIPQKVNRFIDIGTGGGLPGIPLAIVRPLLRGVLVDSTGKKVNAVQEFVSDLRLSNLTAENSRVEGDDFKDKYKDSFDLAISRGTVPLIILFRYALPLLKDKSYIVSVKGGDLNEEFKTAEMKYRSYIKKSTIFELAYKPSNLKNIKGKKLILLEISK